MSIKLQFNWLFVTQITGMRSSFWDSQKEAMKCNIYSQQEI